METPHGTIHREGTAKIEFAPDPEAPLPPSLATPRKPLNRQKWQRTSFFEDSKDFVLMRVSPKSIPQQDRDLLSTLTDAASSVGLSLDQLLQRITEAGLAIPPGALLRLPERSAPRFQNQQEARRWLKTPESHALAGMHLMLVKACDEVQISRPVTPKVEVSFRPKHLKE